MCRLCDEGTPQFHPPSATRRGFLATAVTGGASVASGLASLVPAKARAADERPPEHSGRRGRRLLDPRRRGDVDGPPGWRFRAGPTC